MTLHIKNMVCMRCVRTVKNLFHEAGVSIEKVELGEVHLANDLTAAQRAHIEISLKQEGFELLNDRNSKIVSQIKNLIIDEIHYGAGKKKEQINFSDFLARFTGHEYSLISKLFSVVEGITIEHYIIAQKIEKAKELLVYDELSLNEISHRLNYSSSQHLSTQFRQITGMTPTAFKKDHRHRRQHLDHV